MMRILRTALLLSTSALLIPTSVLAEWVYINGNNDFHSYVETDSIVYKGRQVFFVEREYYAYPDKDGAIVSLQHKSVDCLTGNRYSHRFTGFSRTGKVVYDVGASSAAPAPPGSLGADIYNFVCR